MHRNNDALSLSLGHSDGWMDGIGSAERIDPFGCWTDSDTPTDMASDN